MTATLEEKIGGLQESIESASEAVTGISDRVTQIHKSVDGHDESIQGIQKLVEQVKTDLEHSKGMVDEHITTTRETLKSLAVHSGGHDRPVMPFYSRYDGRHGSGFEFTDIQEAKAFGLYLIGRCARDPAERDMAHKALDREMKQRNWWAESAMKAMEAGNFTAGGALVAEAFLPTIIRNVETHGHFQQNAGKVPMPAPTVTIPKDLTELTIYYPDENVNITESAPTYGDVTFNARLYATLTKWPNSLSEDVAIDFGAHMAEKMAFAHAKARDTNGFIGDGTSTYARVTGAINVSGITTHILGNAIGASLTNTTKTAFSDLAYADLVKIQGLLPTKARANAKWYMHRYIGATCRALVDTNGAPIVQMTPGDFQSVGRYQSLLGDPLIEVDIMPSTSGATTDFILYGDLSLAMGIGVRREVRIANSQEAGFAADQTWVRSTARVAIAKLDGTMLVKGRTSTT